MDIAANIRHYRHALSLTQDDLAVRIGVARSTIAQWETGRTEPRLGALMRVSLALGITVSALLEGHVPHDRQSTDASDWVRMANGRRLETGRDDKTTYPPPPPATSIPAMVEHPDARALAIDGRGINPVAPCEVVVLFDPGLLPAAGMLALVQGVGGPTVMRRVPMGSRPTGSRPARVHPRQVLGTVLRVQVAQAVGQPVGTAVACDTPLRPTCDNSQNDC